jgi:hypothetical protein
VTEYQGKLFVHGDDGGSGAGLFSGIASYDEESESWARVGGLDTLAMHAGVSVWSATVWNGRLVFGGSFAGGVGALDGDRLTSLGCGLCVWDMAVHEGKLIVVGQTPGDVSCEGGSRIRYLDEDGWSDFGGGIEPAPEGCPPFVDLYEVLRTSNGQVVVAGMVEKIDDLAVRNVALFADGRWQAMGKLDPGVSALVDYEGTPWSAEGETAPFHVRRWNGITWEAIGEEFDGPVTDLLCVDGGLLACGGFTGKVVRMRIQTMHAPRGGAYMSAQGKSPAQSRVLNRYRQSRTWNFAFRVPIPALPEARLAM